MPDSLCEISYDTRDTLTSLHNRNMYTLRLSNLLLPMSPCPRVHACCIGLLLLAPLSIAHSKSLPLDEEIETLEVIEITGTVVEKTPRDLKFPVPEARSWLHVRLTDYLPLPILNLVKPIPRHSNILLDQTAKTINLHTPVKPLKTERPVYPRRAREEGWHGRAIIRLEISADGIVQSCTIHQSTGYQLLDDNAINAAKQWTFEPAKNGGFPVSTTVNIPIQFDLVQ